MRNTHWMAALAFVTAGLISVAAPARADDKAGADKAPTAPKDAKPPAPDKPAKKPPAPPKEAPAADGAAAEVKAAKGVADRQPVEEGTSFPAGTKVWAWSSITGAKDTTVKHVWKRDGAVLWEKEMTVTSGRYRTWTRRTVSKPGSYTVEVQTADGAVIGSVEFTVEG